MSRKSSVNKIKRNNTASKNIEASLIMDLYQKGHSPITSHFQGYRFAECDVLSITKSDYVCEYEVKISRSDFKADFKKEKHKLITEKIFNETFTIKKIGNSVYDLPNPYYGPNYLYYVTTENLISVDEIPTYAGLMYFYENGNFSIIKKAPLLHKTKASNELIRALCHQLTCKLVFNKVS